MTIKGSLESFGDLKKMKKCEAKNCLNSASEVRSIGGIDTAFCYLHSEFYDKYIG